MIKPGCTIKISTMSKHICIITGSRAEWGILRPLHDELQKRVSRVSVVVTGSHLHYQSDYSAEEISKDIGEDYHQVYITPENGAQDNQSLMFAAMAGALTRFPKLFDMFRPDLVVYLGDRYEIYAVATACRLLGIRSAHISGGELTAGAFDDVLRHCISKLSDLHFTATEDYRRRVIQLGEIPELVFNTGDLGLADLADLPFLQRSQLEDLTKCALDDFFLITLHPQTCSPGAALNGIKQLLPLLIKTYPGTRLLITGANADPEGEEINAYIKAQADIEPESICFFSSLGRLNYLSAARLARCVIGNSSSGIIEVPSLGVPVLNIGRRQQGRPHSQTVITADFDEAAILQALGRLLADGFREKCALFANPYEGKDSARKIAEIIASIDLNSISREKQFHDLR